MRDFLSARVPDGCVLLHVPTGRYLRANESAATIVGLLAEGDPPSQAARRFAASTGLSLGTAEADVCSLLETLEGLSRSSARTVRRPQLTTIARELAKWWELPTPLRRAVVEVAILLCIVEVGLRTVDVRRLSALAWVPLSDSGEPPSVARGDVSVLRPGEQRLLWAVEWLDGRWLAPVTCLRRALVTGFALRRRDPVLRLGITGGGSTAHAWVEADGLGFGVEEVAGVFASPG